MMKKHLSLGILPVLVTLLYACPVGSKNPDDGDRKKPPPIPGSVPSEQPIGEIPFIAIEEQEEQTDKTLDGIEQLEWNVFKVYESYSLYFERDRIENRIAQTDLYPTGLYVKPHQSITVSVESDGETGNLRLFTGTYSRYTDCWDPDTFTLKQGTNIITNPRNKPRFIYIRFSSGNMKLDTAQVTIKGAEKAPYFIHGKTTTEEFQTMLREYDYESILIATNTMMMVAGKETALKVQDQDWEETARLLHKVVEVAEYIHGLDSETYWDTPPTTRIFAVERESNSGPMSATKYRISTPKWGMRSWIDNTQIVKSSSWGLWHETGHMYEPAQTLIGETSTNIYSLAIQRAFNKKSRLVSDKKWPQIKAYLAKPEDEKHFNGLNVFIKLGMLQQLWLGYGTNDRERDQFFITLHKKIRQESISGISGSSQSLAYLMLKSSDVYGYNLNSFFRKWGFASSVPQSAFDAVDALNLPDPPVDISSLQGE